jgi:TatD DNase family protein
MKYNLHTHNYKNLEGVFEVVNQYPLEFTSEIPKYSIGIHPWYIKNDTLKKELFIIEEKLKSNECLALGECGLDKRIEIPFDIQVDVFKSQLVLAKEYKKPIILHCVSAYQEVIAIKKELSIENPMIIHGFSKNIKVAKSLLDNGFYLSFGKYLLRNPDLASVFEQVPNDRFFLETDMIEETIFDVYQRASQIKNIDIESQVEETFKRVFYPEIL